MELGTISKKKILDLFKGTAIYRIKYNDFYNIIKTSRTKICNNDILNYLSEKAIFELEKEEKLSSNKFSKIIYSITLIIRYEKEVNTQIDRMIIKKVNQILLKYKEYLKSKNIEIESDELINQLEVLIKDDLEVLNEEEKASSVEIKQLTEELEDTKKLIIDYEKKISDISKKHYELEKALKKSKITSEQLENSRKNLQTNIRELNQEIREYQNQIQKLLKDIKENKVTIASLNELNNSLKKEMKNMSDKNEALMQKVADLLIKLSKYEAMEFAQNKTQRIKDIILTELYQKPNSIENLTNILNQQGYSVTSQIVYEHLNALKMRVGIKGPILETIPPIYKIDTEPLTISNPFYLPIPSMEKEMDILLIADLHKNFHQDLLVPIDIAYNYSSANNIRYIFNLGDIFNTSLLYNDKNNTGLEVLKMVEQWIQEFSDCVPQNAGIYLLNIGGNHDRKFLEVGIDPLNRLQQHRPDFINLGYTHVNVVLGNQLKKDNCLAFHHPRQRLEENIGENLKQKSAVRNYLSNYYSCYKKSLISRDMIYCDFLAHIHRSKLDLLNSYCQVPSYTRDRLSNGAWHLKIYLDSEKNIECIIFISLAIINNKLKPVLEIPYQKTKKK